MRIFLLTFLGGLAALVVFFVLIPLVLIISFIPSAEPARVNNAVLEIDLREGFPDQPATNAVNSILSGTSFIEVLLRLNAAADDPAAQRRRQILQHGDVEPSTGLGGRPMVGGQRIEGIGVFP